MDNLINNNNIKKEKYCSCEFLENGLIFFSGGVRHCCGELPVNMEALEMYEYDRTFFEDVDKFIRKIIDKKKEIISLNRAGQKTICTGCSYLQERYWENDKKITCINFSLNSVCNFKCRYCYTVREKDYKSDENGKAFEIINTVMNSDYINADTKILYASGEITIQKDINKIINLIKDNDVSLFSNATSYNVKIHNMIKRPNNSLIVSVDSGTRETFKNIKGVDLFEEIWKNIGLYASEGGNVIVKYIIMGVNSNSEDLDGFIDMCVKNNIRHIRVAKDWLYDGGDATNSIFAASSRLIKKAIKNNIIVHNDGTTII